MRDLPLILMASSFMGCLDASPNQPLTTADLDGMAMGRVFNVSLERAGVGAAFSLESNSPKAPSKILRALSPVISSKAAVGGDGEPEYIFIIQSGRNPLVFHIRVCGDVLCYRVGNTDYQGGDARGFLNVVEELTPLFRQPRVL